MTAWHHRKLDDGGVTNPAAPTVRRFVGVHDLRCVAVLLWVLLVFPLGSARADVDSAPLLVSVQVLPHATLLSDIPEARLLVTPADLERGYVDFQRHYQLQTNALDRVALQIHPRLGLAESVDVMGFSGPLRLVETTLEVFAPQRHELDLSFRVYFLAAVTPGEYALPVHVTATVR